MRAEPYGDHPEQTGDLHLPDGPGPHPVVLLWHGGGFEAPYGRDMLTAAAEDLAARGWAAYNVTYRRLGSDGGWPATFDDARAALAHVAALDAPLDLGDVSALGFSAGLPLACHAVARADEVRVRRLVNVAGLSALADAARLGPGTSAWQLLGDPDARPDVYAEADPAALLPLGVPSLHLHGDADALVPLAMSEEHVRLAVAAGDEAELAVLPGAGHFDITQPGSPGWQQVVAWLASGGGRRARRRP